MTKSDFIQKMNQLGSERLPFLFIIDFNFDNPIIIPLDEINSDEILFQTPKFTNCKVRNFQIPAVNFQKDVISFDEYKKKFDFVKSQILLGNSYLLNLTCPTKIKINLTPQEIFKFSKAKYKLYYQNKFVCFSPEIFVTINDGIISSYPMKGTIDADIPDALDLILNDEKEFAEHNTIVDLIRNDLSIVAKKVRVRKFRYPDYLQTNQKNLIQISSEISGELPTDWHSKIGDIFAKLLPAGSVTGAPKIKTVEIIKDTEQYDRGYYTGVFGIFDGFNLDSAVMIRFIENTDNGMIFKSGGGITSMSEVNSEYQELIDKVYVPIY
jgi:para-aminobenzoate synthetase component 1